MGRSRAAFELVETAAHHLANVGDRQLHELRLGMRLSAFTYLSP